MIFPQEQNSNIIHEKINIRITSNYSRYLLLLMILDTFIVMIY